MSDLPVLDEAEQRILGSLIEKQRTVPASYPLSLNALRTACNQSNSREPVVAYDEQTVEQVARALKDRGLVRIVWAPTGRRTLKYHQTLEEALGLGSDEVALLALLLLRGPQAPGALKSRSERLHPFGDRSEVESCLARMAAVDPPLVEQQARRPREQDHRWTHLLGSAEQTGAAVESAPSPDRESVIVDGGAARDAKVRSAYDAVAASYAEALVDELDGLPFERWLLDRVARATGPVVEVGCGPGHVTAHLARAGAEATGLDLSPEMIEQARRRFPGGSYRVGDLRELIRPETASGWGAVLAWYSLIHLADSELADAAASLVRPLAPGGTLLVAVHAGAQMRRNTSWFDHEIDLDFVFHEPARLVEIVTEAGLTEVEWYRRGPVRERGETTERLYVLARKPV